jgi:hypothetical protein
MTATLRPPRNPPPPPSAYPEGFAEALLALHSEPGMNLSKIPARLRRFFWRDDNQSPVQLTELGWWLALVAPLLPPTSFIPEMVRREVPPIPKLEDRTPYQNFPRWGEAEVLTALHALCEAGPSAPSAGEAQVEALLEGRFRALPPSGMLGMGMPMLGLLDLGLWCAGQGCPVSLDRLRRVVADSADFTLRTPQYCDQLELVSYRGLP